MTVRTVSRRGVRRLIIDIVFRNPDGTHGRFRRDADVQTLAAARSEERRRLGLLAATGSPWGDTPRPDAPSASLPVIAAATARAVAPTFAALAEDYLRDYAVSELKPSTVYGYEVVLRQFLIPRIGTKPIDTIDSRIVRELDVEMVRRKSRPSTRRNIQVVLRSVLGRYAVEIGLFTEPPRLPRMPRVGATIVAVLSSEELQRILDAAGDEYRLAFMLAAFAGLRAGEVRGLRWRVVDFGAGRLVTRQSICRGVVAPPKSGLERPVPLTTELRQMLDAVASKPRDGYVTHRSDGEPWTEFALRKALQRECIAANLEGWRFHDMRHYFVTALFRAGVGAPTVQALAGHSELSTTQRYAHAAEVDLEDAIGRLRGNSVVTEPGEASRASIRRDR